MVYEMNEIKSFLAPYNHNGWKYLIYKQFDSLEHSTVSV